MEHYMFWNTPIILTAGHFAQFWSLDPTVSYELSPPPPRGLYCHPLRVILALGDLQGSATQQANAAFAVSGCTISCFQGIHDSDLPYKVAPLRISACGLRLRFRGLRMRNLGFVLHAFSSSVRWFQHLWVRFSQRGWSRSIVSRRHHRSGFSLLPDRRDLSSRFPPKVISIFFSPSPSCNSCGFLWSFVEPFGGFRFQWVLCESSSFLLGYSASRSEHCR